MVYEEMVNAIGQGVFTGLFMTLSIVFFVFLVYHLVLYAFRKIVPRIKAKLKSRKIGKSENNDQSNKDH